MASGRQSSARSAVEHLRTICLALPEATEKLAWGEPTWRVKGRLFAQLDDHHHGADHLAVWLPAPLGEQEAMIFTNPARFFRPPYVGHRGWIGVRLDRRPDWKAVAILVEQAYRLVAPPRLRAALGVPRVSPNQEATPRRLVGSGLRRGPRRALGSAESGVSLSKRRATDGLSRHEPTQGAADARDRHGVQRPEARRP